jgi:hypothetical protein
LVAVGLGVKLLDLTGVFGVGPVHHLILLSFPFNADAFGLGMGVAVAEVLYVGRQGRVAGQPWQRFATAGVAAKAGVTQGGVGGLLVNLAGVLAVSLAVSALTHRWLEVPVMTLAHRGAVRRHLDQRATEQRAGGQRSTEPLSDVRASAVW